MQEIKAWLLAVSCLFASHSILAAEHMNLSTEVDQLLQYAGIYRLGGQHLVSIDVVTDTAAAPALVYTDLDTYQVRRLYSAGPDSFTAGPTFSTREPLNYRLRFGRDASNIVSSLDWSDEALDRHQSGARERLEREDVVVPNGAINLHGTLHKPARATHRLPLIVWLHGSSRAQRHGLFGLPQILAYHGFAVLAYDKRGVGQSQGDYVTAGFDELASDAVAALTVMKARPDIDPKQMGVMGTSQGGWLSFRAARMSPDVRFIVDLYGTPVTVGEQILFDLRRDLEGMNAEPADIEQALALQTQVIEYMRDGKNWDQLREQAATARDKRWFKSVFISYEGKLTPQIRDSGVAKMVRHEPLADIRAFQGPVLYMVGDFDRLVDVEHSTSLMARTLSAGGNPDFSIVVVPKAHHQMTLGVSGAPEERYRGLNNSTQVKSLAPGYIDILVRWLHQRVGGATLSADRRLNAR